VDSVMPFFLAWARGARARALHTLAPAISYPFFQRQSCDKD
jgi:hypothetical protein